MLIYCSIGGTIDLIVFKVKSDISGKMKYEESTEGMGESCGSTFVDGHFRKCLKKKLGKAFTNANQTIEIPDKPFERMINDFIGNIKINLSIVLLNLL